MGAALSRGLILPGERKSLTPLADRVAPGERQQLHNFISDSPWDTLPLEGELVKKANLLVGGRSSTLQVDDVSLVKKGAHSVGVAHQWCGELGKNANCQVLVSLTLACGEVPITIGLRLFLPKVWDEDQARRRECAMPEAVEFKAKWRIALDEIDRVLAQGALFGLVQADAGYGMVGEFRRGLSERALRYTVGIPKNQKVFSLAVAPASPAPRKGRPPKAPLRGEFIAVRVRAADGEADGNDQHAPGEAVWLIAERRADGEIKHHFSTLPESATLLGLSRNVKGRWACEQPHQQLKEELGLDHYEGRGWLGLHHHCLLTMIAFCFLQRLRLGGKKGGAGTGLHRGPACPRCAGK